MVYLSRIRILEPRIEGISISIKGNYWHIGVQNFPKAWVPGFYKLELGVPQGTGDGTLNHNLALN
jgi:hypothetical protein